MSDDSDYDDSSESNNDDDESDKKPKAKGDNKKRKTENDGPKKFATIIGEFHVLVHYGINTLIKKVSKLKSKSAKTDKLFESYIATLKTKNRIIVNKGELQEWVAREIANPMIENEKRERDNTEFTASGYSITIPGSTCKAALKKFNEDWVCVYCVDTAEGKLYNQYRADKYYACLCECQRDLYSQGERKCLCFIRIYKPITSGDNFRFVVEYKKDFAEETSSRFMWNHENSNNVTLSSFDALTEADVARLKLDTEKIRKSLILEIFYELSDDYNNTDMKGGRLERLNKDYYKRDFNQTSRPSFAVIGEMRDATAQVRDLFFKPGGQLKASEIIDRKTKLHYIAINDKEKDKRYMISFEESKDDNSVFMRLHSILSKSGILNSEEEELYDIALLMGGTLEQPVHFDTPRIFGVKRKPGTKRVAMENFVIVHELNRELYNADIMGEWAPTSIILDVTGRECGIKLGLLNDFLNDPSEKTTVRWGKEGDKMSVSKLDEDRSIIHAKGAGVQFLGDFPHFGVRNIDENDNNLNEKMNSFFKEIDKNKSRKSIVNLFENTEGLNELCRLFVKTKPKKSVFQLYGMDAVGKMDIAIIRDHIYDYPPIARV